MKKKLLITSISAFIGLSINCSNAKGQGYRDSCKYDPGTLKITTSVQYPCNGSPYVLKATPGFNVYRWYNQSSYKDTTTTSNQITLTSWGVMTCTGYDTLNSKCNSGTIAISSILGSNASTTDPICGVSVDANNHNVISWEKKQANLSGYVVKDNARVVGQIPITGLSKITDLLSDARKKSYTYTLMALDKNGCELNAPDFPIKDYAVGTILLQSSIGQNNLRNLVWNEYNRTGAGTIMLGSGDPFYYNIWVGKDTANMVLTDSILSYSIQGAHSTYLWTDVNAPMTDTYYQIEIPSFYSSCVPSYKMEGGATTIKSNIARCSPNVFLISVENRIKVFGIEAEYTLNVYNLLGQEIINSDLKTGIYIAKVKYENKEYNQKVFVQ